MGWSLKLLVLENPNQLHSKEPVRPQKTFRLDPDYSIYGHLRRLGVARPDIPVEPTIETHSVPDLFLVWDWDGHEPSHEDSRMCLYSYCGAGQLVDLFAKDSQNGSFAKAREFLATIPPDTPVVLSWS